MTLDARPAIVVTHTRSGGCWLMHCLSSHPDIHCTRGEPLLPASSHRLAFPGVSDVAIIRAITEIEQFPVGMVKVTYNQFSDEIKRHVKQQHISVLHLTRRNVVRVAVSQKLTSLSLRTEHVAHSYEHVPVYSVAIDPQWLVKRCHHMMTMMRNFDKQLGSLGVPVLDLFYGHLVGGEGSEASQMVQVQADRICDFLEIERRPLFSRLKRVNRYPLRKIISNWREVKPVIKDSQFAWCLKEERMPGR